MNMYLSYIIATEQKRPINVQNRDMETFFKKIKK